MGKRSAFWRNGLRLGEIGFIFNRVNISWGREDGRRRSEIHRPACHCELARQPSKARRPGAQAGRFAQIGSRREEDSGQRSGGQEWAV